jgi:hypothetical protein
MLDIPHLKAARRLTILIRFGLLIAAPGECAAIDTIHTAGRE